MANETETGKVAFSIQRTLRDPHAPPVAAHKFMWTRVGTEIVLEVGFFDLVNVREAVERHHPAAARGLVAGGMQMEGEPATEEKAVQLVVTHRFVISAMGVEDLASQVIALRDDVRAHLTPKGDKE